MFSALAVSSRLPLIVLRHETRSNQKWLGDFGHGSRRQSQATRQHVQPRWTFEQDAEVLLLRGPEAQMVDSFKRAGSFQMSTGDDLATLRPVKHDEQLEAVAVPIVAFLDSVGQS